MKLDAIALCRSSSLNPNAAFNLDNVSAKKVESAPCLVNEPTSSLSKIAITLIDRSFPPASKASIALNEHCRSSR